MISVPGPLSVADPREALRVATSRPPGAHRRRIWHSRRPVDLHAVLAPMRRGTGDPTYQVDAAGAIWRTTRTPAGPATTRFEQSGDTSVAAAAWGPGAEWALDTLPDLLGADDCAGAFRPAHPVVRDSWRRHRGWRVPRSRLVLEALLPAVLEQKVTTTEAWRAWRYLLRRFGDTAPGPAGTVLPGLRVTPAPHIWRDIPSWEWHRAGVDHARCTTAVRAATVAGRLEQTAVLPPDEARCRLQVVHGVGTWTSAEVAQRALGDADAVSVGDAHLSSLVGWALVRERVDDDAMLELLEPYRGHRYRVVRMIELSGLRPPRRAPRYAPRDYRRR